MTPPILLLATSNEDKIREIVEILADLPVQFRNLKDYPGLAEPVEDAETFLGNAEKKALHYAKLTGLWALADDSGLEVDCLNGLPGVHSARFAGPQRDPLANNRKLVTMLAGIPLEQRRARFWCAAALAKDGQIAAFAEDAVEGLVIDEPRGKNGFGYDPHFLVPELGRTTAELEPEHKNAISHRGKAVRRIGVLIREIFLKNEEKPPR